MIDLSRPIFGRWEIIKELGSGKHGVVYEARDVYDGTPAAVKIISLPNDEMKEYAVEEYGNNRALIDNFVGMVAENFGNEVESMSKLKNVPYVVELYDNRLEQTGWRDRDGNMQRGYDIILVMEYATPIKDHFRHRALRVRDVIDFASDIALGLAACEKLRIIHRDIKEDNLFMGSDGYGKISDFGVACIKESGLGSTAGMGTPYYMAPEIANAIGRGRTNYDSSVDIYSLGIVLYKMLNGNKFPFADETGETARTALDRRMSGEPLPLPRYANDSLGKAVVKCCEFQPQRRFRNANALYRALTSVRESMSEQELDRVLPYLYIPSDNDTGRWDDDEWRLGGHGRAGDDDRLAPDEPDEEDGGKWGYDDGDDGQDIPWARSSTQGGTAGSSSGRSDALASTISVLADLTGTVAAVFRGLLRAVSSGQKDEMDEMHKRRQRRNIIILVSAVVAALAAVLVMLYPKTATFYADPSDGNKIHVKYLFLPDMAMTDKPASYLAVDGNWIYFSDPDEDHSLYRMSIWSGEPELMCTDDCEYNIVIGDYVYFTSYDEGEILCRMKKDNTGEKEYVLEYACRDLRRNGDNLMFVLAETGELMELDTMSIGQ